MDQGCPTRPDGDDRDFAIAICRSLIYEMLAIGFRPPGVDPPPPPDAARLARGRDLAGLLDDLRGGGLRAASLELSRHRPDPAVHDGLFGHTARARVPAYETEYGDDALLQRPHELSDIGGFLGAFGLRNDPRSHERVDHVACELEFLAFLARKLAYALETGDTAMRDDTRRAEALFLRDHVGRFIPSFCARVRREDPAGYYGALAALCHLLVLDDCRAHAIEPGPETLRLRLPLEDGAPVACGTVDCAPGGGCGPPEPAAGGSMSEGA
jgi:TorA maturation chaperone TorD